MASRKKAVAPAQPLADWLARLHVSTQKPVAFDIQADPLRFAHRYAHPADAECVAFVSALSAYGQRPLILALLERLLEPLGPNPVQWLLNQPSDKAAANALRGVWPDFRYRFNTREDFIWLMGRLRRVYAEHGGLEALLIQSDRGDSYQQWLACWMDGLLGPNPPASNGLRYLLAHPARNGSCKRLHLFLRWMVRGPDGVDLGLWRNSLTPDQLLMPVDTHVAKAGRHLGLITRKANDWKTVEELTTALRQTHPHDPVSLDTLLFQLGQQL